MLTTTFIRKLLRLKAHTVTLVTGIEGNDTQVVIEIDRLGSRLLRCGVCRQRCRRVHSRRKQRTWRDLALRDRQTLLRYRPYRVRCPRCGVRVEDFPWVRPWERVTQAQIGRASCRERVYVLV